MTIKFNKPFKFAHRGVDVKTYQGEFEEDQIPAEVVEAAKAAGYIGTSKKAAPKTKSAAKTTSK